MTRLRSSLRYAPAPEAFPTVVGWPFAWIESSEECLAFGTGMFAPFRRERWRVERDKISRVERTQGGVRFYAEGFPDPWVTASLFPNRFLRRLRELGIESDGPIQPSTWTKI